MEFSSALPRDRGRQPPGRQPPPSPFGSRWTRPRHLVGGAWRPHCASRKRRSGGGGSNSSSIYRSRHAPVAAGDFRRPLQRLGPQIQKAPALKEKCPPHRPGATSFSKVATPAEGARGCRREEQPAAALPASPTRHDGDASWFLLGPVAPVWPHAWGLTLPRRPPRPPSRSTHARPSAGARLRPRRERGCAPADAPSLSRRRTRRPP